MKRKAKPVALKKRGPKPLDITAEQRENVSIWKAGGMSDQDIARSLGMDDITMKKYFAEELATHWAKKTSAVLSALYAAAINGNVAGIKKWLEPSRAVSGEADFTTKAAPGRKVRILPVGKKEAADEAAKNAGLGTDWGTDLQVPGTVQ